MKEGGLDLEAHRPRRSLWQRIVDVALTDVGVLVRGIDAGAIERLERVLLEADFGVDATLDLVAALERAAKRGEVKTEAGLRDWLGERIAALLAAAVPGGGIAAAAAAPDAGGASPAGAGTAGGTEAGTAAGAAGPHVILLLGVNGVGKTTVAARLARRLGGDGRVLLAAADTFRSGAREQLRVWSERVGAEFVGGEPGADPASVAYDAAAAAGARGCRWLIVDTAGRLHTRGGLMEELKKIDRVLGRLVPGAPHQRLLVVDATSGQNVLAQAREFGAALPLTGLVLAKYDSSARGGTAVAVARELSLPVLWLGTGETADDLEPFDPSRYVRKLLAAE